MTDQAGETETDPQFKAFFQRLLDKSAAQRLPELFRNPPADALYHLPNREGVSVVALTPMTLLRLSRDAYARYLAHMVEVDSQLTHTALDRTRDTLRAVRVGGE